MPYTQKSSTRLYYEVHGSGPSLVLISGLGGDLGFWADSVQRLQDHFQVITFDNRGIGRSDAPDIPYSMELLADDLAQLLEELQVERTHILGFSMGGCVAQAFALKYPERIQKLILAATYARINPQAELFLDAVLSAYESGITSKQMYYLILPWLFSPHFLKGETGSAFLEFDENDPLQQPLYAFRRQYQAQKAFDSRERLHHIRALTLIIAGEVDALVSPSEARELEKGIDQSHITWIQEAGHLFNVEKSALFHNAVMNFLK